MKKVGLLILALLVGVATVSAKMPQQMSSSDPDEIILSSQNGNTTGRPRSAEAVQIEAFHYESLSVVELYLSSAGEFVSVSICNLSSGENYDYQVLGTGSFVLPISSSSGWWVITITLETGEVFSGAFIQ